MTVDISKLVDRLRGRFIVFDGCDGGGKSTQRDLVADELRAAGGEVVRCRDPGGTEIGDRIRSVLLDYDLAEMNVNCEALLFMASRAQLVAEVIKPALEADKTVLCDRFITSTFAYQGAAGFDTRRVIELARFAVGDCWPDLTVILDLEPSEGFARVGRKSHHAGKNRRRVRGQGTLLDGAEPDAMEARSLEFHRSVRRLFIEVGAHYPAPVVVVDAGRDRATVHEKILEVLRQCR